MSNLRRTALLISILFIVSFVGGCLSPEALRQVSACATATTGMERAACQDAQRRNQKAIAERQAHDKYREQRRVEARQKQLDAEFEIKRLQNMTAEEIRAEEKQKKNAQEKASAAQKAEYARRYKRDQKYKWKSKQRVINILRIAKQGGASKQPAELAWLNGCWYRYYEPYKKEEVIVYAVMSATKLEFISAWAGQKFDGDHMSVDLKLPTERNFKLVDHEVHITRGKNIIRRIGQDQLEYEYHSENIITWKRCR